ncbi:MAG: hypothetical protein US34_C0024G0002 [Candidatus Nomurabacteria bacterium GW2011_GWC2_36_9]|nr:MAG: hypothetical protein US34_C0024G0002 [Candidatus Nomurabacteria bacterium GW2011_GWC2_36_9]
MKIASPRQKLTIMYVEIVTPNPDSKQSRFALQDLTIEELEIIQSSLVTFKQHSLQDPEVFKIPRQLIVAMFQKIDQELVNARS